MQFFIRAKHTGGDGLTCSACCVHRIDKDDEFVIHVQLGGGGIQRLIYCAACFNFSPDWVGLPQEELPKLQNRIDDEVFLLTMECGEAVRCFKCKQIGHRFTDCKVIGCENCGSPEHPWPECARPHLKHQIMDTLEVFAEVEPTEGAEPVFVHYFCLCGAVIERKPEYEVEHPECFKVLTSQAKLPEVSRQYGY